MGNFKNERHNTMQREFYKMASTRKFRLEYYITRGEVKTEGATVSTFGIEIMKKQRKNGVILMESKCANNICVSETQVRRLIDLLAENLVTPITLNDIVEDLTFDGKINSPSEQILLDTLAAM